jgi:hypothetical protein
MIIGSKVDGNRLLTIVQVYSTEIHQTIYQLQALLNFLGQVTDQQMQQLFIDDGADSTTATNNTNAIRGWQAVIQNWVLNYTGGGVLQDNSFAIAPRYNPPGF